MLPKLTERMASRRLKQAIACLTLATTIFRAELAILLATTGLYLLSSGRMQLRAMVAVFVVSFIGSLVISVPIDSYFWQRLVWPELSGFYYNAVQGSSSDWGVSPYHYYFTSALPRLLLSPLAPILMLLALSHPGTSRQAWPMAIPSVLFVIIYSAQPHKEARFIFYVIPPLNAVAAIGANFLSSRLSKALVYRLATYAVALSVPLALAASSAMLLVSALNYPGGDALAQLRSLVASDAASLASAHGGDPSVAPREVTAHADVLTCMTGLTLFGQNPQGLPLALYNPGSREDMDPSITPLLLVDKTERKATLGWPHFWARLEYALEENPGLPLGDWDVVGVVHGFDGIEILRPGQQAGGEESPSLNQLPGEDRVLGLAVAVDRVRQAVRALTGGWWIGPRMAPRIRVMRQIEHA